MRQLSAILLICLFAASQYARHLAYLECRVLNTIRPAAEPCDCEKLVITENSGNPIPSSPLNHLHIPLEEFLNPPADVLTGLFPTPIKVINNYSSQEEAAGCRTPPWQPPDC